MTLPSTAIKDVRHWYRVRLETDGLPGLRGPQQVHEKLQVIRAHLDSLEDGRVSFEEASEAVAFLAGQYMADQCHEDRAKTQEDDATELTVAT